jgi:hypothetical protein
MGAIGPTTLFVVGSQRNPRHRLDPDRLLALGLPADAAGVERQAFRAGGCTPQVDDESCADLRSAC